MFTGESPAHRKLNIEDEIEILRLFDSEGLKARAISDKTGINVGSVQWQLKKHKRTHLTVPLENLSHEELVAKREADKVRAEALQERNEMVFRRSAVTILRKIEVGLKKFKLDPSDAEACLAFTRAADMTLERHRRVLGLPDPPKSRARKE